MGVQRSNQDCQADCSSHCWEEKTCGERGIFGSLHLLPPAFLYHPCILGAGETVHFSPSQFIVFIYHQIIDMKGARIVESILIFDPNKKEEFWRFLTYFMVQFDFGRLMFYTTVQVGEGGANSSCCSGCPWSWSTTGGG